MESKSARIMQILQEDGPLKLIEKVYNHYLYTEPINQPKLHLQLLQDKQDIAAAEIGVWEGTNAEYMLNQLDIDVLYLIDPYDAYDEYPERKSNPNRMSAAQKKAQDRLKKFSNIKWIQKYSDQAIDNIDRKLDYVYVDGNHHYKYVRSDIENYYELLSQGGIIAGDDADWTGVAQAVCEFAIENEVQPHFEKSHPDWFIIKDRPLGTDAPLPHSVESTEITRNKHSI